MPAKKVTNHNFLSEHQYGGQEGIKAIDIPVLIAWQLDIFQISRSNTTFADYDAKVCYDRAMCPSPTPCPPIL
eukprot:9783738-Ditylum_brightwellii.AAC.1